MDIRNIEKLMKEMAQSDNTSLQSHGLSALITQVKEFVAVIDKQRDLVRSIPELTRTASMTAEKPEDQEAIAKARDALQKAQQLKSTIHNKERLLHQLESEVEGLLREIKKAK